MDPIRFCVAVGPLAAYLVLLAAINLLRRPLLVSGGRDTAALGLAISGMMLVGPIELLLPSTAANNFGSRVWLLVAILYALLLTLFVLLERPRLVIYNIPAEQLQRVLAAVVPGLDADARWAGSTVYLPTQQIEFRVEYSFPMQNASLIPAGQNQNLAGWLALKTALKTALQSERAPASRWGLTLAVLGLLLVVAMSWQLVLHSQLMVQAFRDWLPL